MRASRARLACLLLLPTLACQAGGQPPDGSPAPDGPGRSAATAGTDGSLREQALALLDERERALADGDREAFLATVDPDELGFSATQARWFDNLARLPVGDVSFELGDEDALADDFDDGELRLPVEFTMRLRGFDSRPVTDKMVWTFVHEDDVLLAGDRDEQVDVVNGWIPAPWDLAHIEVRRAGGILAVFDEDTSEHAGYVMSDLADATAVVKRHFPDWSGRYVAYGTSDTTAIAEMSGMSVDRTAGVAFPVLARPGGPVAAYRFAVNPTVVGDVLSRGLVFRHELAHVALGATDDRSPVWLMEGAAEYVARSTMPVGARRRIAAYQLGGTSARTLEPTRSFYTGDPTLSYNLAAVVCDYVATTRGEAALWDLVRTFRTARFFSWAQTEDVVRRELGLSTKELSAQALAWARAA
ncbi:hypothetical protein IEZ26_18810 [Nocardioides cavernae]|uniref:Peptidase MA-like domain-containing protein n=1 Tax=Nocardioides cavernae TaxID=1921566 RepID=A0ABR8NGH1_9ACTN|nr:hypothetical protein [Nocardioides cavernae]MBD3926677.1 hypothetical protein [Nocardioides cavernae]MBM7512399.1 hypothetical protein [Nocardioides cavernae]